MNARHACRVVGFNNTGVDRHPDVNAFLAYLRLRWLRTRDLNWGGTTDYDDNHGIERDSYDQPKTFYLAALCGDHVIAGVRLLPVWLPGGSMLRDHFAGAAGSNPDSNLFRAGISLPSSRRVTEFSRLVSLQTADACTRRRGVNAVIDALHQLCLHPDLFTGMEEPITEAYACCYPWLWDSLEKRGCDVRRLGEPKLLTPAGEEPCWAQAGLIAISGSATGEFRRRTGVEASLEFGAWPSPRFVTDFTPPVSFADCA